MGEESASQKFRMENKEESRNYFMKEIDQNELMSNKCRKVCTTLNYVEHLLICVSAVAGCVFISTFATLVGVPIPMDTSL